MFWKLGKGGRKSILGAFKDKTPNTLKREKKKKRGESIYE